jgi:condensation domain-containing protein
VSGDNGARTYPVSFGQEGRFDLDRELTRRGIPVPNWYLMKAYRILGELDVEALERSFADVVRSHEALATRFEEHEGSIAQVVDAEPEFDLDLIDLSSEPAVGGRRVQEIVRDLAEERLDRTRRTQLQAPLLRLGPREHVLVVSVDHIVYDVYSEAVLLDDLSAAYRRYSRGEDAADRRADALQFPAYAQWQRANLDGEGLRRSLDDLRSRLGDADPVTALRLPFVRPEPALAWRVGLAQISLSPDLGPAVDALCRARRMSRFPFYLAVLQTLVHLESGLDSFAVRSGVANRIRPGSERAIGWFANSVVLTAHVKPPQTFAALMDAAWSETLSAIDAQSLPLELVLQHLQPEAYPSAWEIPAIGFTLLEEELDAQLDLGGPEVLDAEEVFELADDYPLVNAVLSMFLQEGAAGGELSARFRQDVYDEDGVQHFIERFGRLASLAVSGVERTLDDLGAALRHSEPGTL